MSEQFPDESDQNLEFSGDASVESSQLGGQAGRDATIAQNQGSGSIFQGLTFNFFSNSAESHTVGVSKQEYRNRQILLNKVKHYWIKGVLEKSLHDKISITLDLEIRFDAVASPWNSVWETSSESPEPVSQFTQFTSIFDELGEGRTLLILGEPGSGKTNTLLRLTRDLIARAEQNIDCLIPVVFNLSSWSKFQLNIAHWLIDELNTKYQVPQKTGQMLVNQDQLILMLDGLDEVRAEEREDCILALNTFHQEHNPEIVVCSRLRDYEILSNRLNFERAICLKPLTLKQVYDYLEKSPFDLTKLQSLVKADLAVQESIKSPLMLHIMVLAYQANSFSEFPRAELVEEYRHCLFESYIDSMLKRRGNSQHYTREQTLHWLHWLAQKMSQNSQMVFLIERIQPNWLNNQQQRRFYKSSLALLVGLIGGLSLGVLSQLSLGLIEQGWTTQLILSLHTGLIMTTVFGFILGGVTFFLREEVTTVETLKWSAKKAIKSSLLWMAIGFSIGFGGGFFVSLIESFLKGELRLIFDKFWLIKLIKYFRLFDGVLGSIAGLIYGLTGGIEGSEIEVKTLPNQAIRRSALSASILSLVGGIMGGLIGSLTAGLMESVRSSDGLISGLTIGLIAGFWGGGGIACVKHFLLRFILYKQGVIPWNYANFLDYATERIFLQKVGGGYIFIHRLLLEHFAEFKTEVK